MAASNPPRQNVVAEEQNVRRQRAARQPYVSNGDSNGVLSDREIEEMLTPEEASLPRRSTFPNQTGNNRPQAPPPGPIEEEAPGADPTHGPGPSSTPYPDAPKPPTTDELDRMERYIALQERAARIPPPVGHRFGVLKVTQNARAVRGTVYAGESIHVRLRLPEASNEYGDTIVQDNGGVIEGVLEIGSVDDYFGARRDANREDEGGAAASSTESGTSTTESDGTDDGNAEVRTNGSTRDGRNAATPPPAYASRP